MQQRLIILTDSGKGPGNGALVTQRNAITEVLRGKGWEIWHWFEDVWFVVTNGGVDISQLRVELTDMLGVQKHVMVMDVEGPIKYAGMGPVPGWPWMAKNWGAPMPNPPEPAPIPASETATT